MIGNLIGAGASLLGGLLSKSAQEDANARAEANAVRNIEMQKQFAQEGIRWKVADAQAAGIHPLYALGASTTSFAPVSVGVTPATGLASGLAAAGQDVGRAINSTRTSGEQQDAFTKAMQTLQLQRGALENDLLASKLRTANQPGNGPASPTLGVNPNSAEAFGAAASVPREKEFEDRKRLAVGGREILTSPGATNAQDFEDRYGDVGENIAGIANALQDLWVNIQKSPYGRNFGRSWDNVGARMYDERFSRSRGFRGPR